MKWEKYFLINSQHYFVYNVYHIFYAINCIFICTVSMLMFLTTLLHQVTRGLCEQGGWLLTISLSTLMWVQTWYLPSICVNIYIMDGVFISQNSKSLTKWLRCNMFLLSHDIVKVFWEFWLYSYTWWIHIYLMEL